VICMVEGCGRRARSQKSGLCSAHAERKRRHGSVQAHVPVGRPGLPSGHAGTLEERFESKVRFNANEWGCDIWTGAKNNGYGRINGQRVDGKAGVQYRAHVLAWEWKNGSVPEGLELDHYRFPGACIGPSCCNPDHVRPVTHAENSLRSSSPPALNSQKTHCPKGHEYTEENTYRKPSTNYRECCICIRERWQA
jgi:hypothetical protein